MKITNRSSFIMDFGLRIALAIFVLGIFTHAAKGASVDIIEGNEWYFFIGEKEPPSKWNHIGYDKQDKDWIKSRTGIGYSHQRMSRQLGDMRNNYRTIYSRRDLTLSNAAYKFWQQDSTKITLSMVCDGSFKVWLNGIEVIRSQNERGAPGEEVQQASEIDITDFAQELLLPGKNVLAAECSNDVIDSGSFLFIPSLRVRGR